MTKSKRVSCGKRPRRNFTAKEVAEMCTESDSEVNSDIDSATGEISSAEEEKLDQQLQRTSDSEIDLR